MITRSLHAIIGSEILVLIGTRRLKTLPAESGCPPFEKYKKWLDRQPVSACTRRAYCYHVKQFLAFVGANKREYACALDNAGERDFAVRDYKTYVKRSLKLRPNSVNSALAAIDHFCQFLGLGKTKVKREDLPQETPRALSPAEQKRFLRAAERCRRPKDTAVAFLLLYTGIRIGECVDLDVDDVYASGRKRRVIVRSGKGDRYREVPLNKEAAEAICAWLKARATWLKKLAEKLEDREPDAALFLNPQGRRMSTSAIDLIVRKIGHDCGIDLSAHRLRHSCLTNLVRQGSDLVLVAEIGGHRRLETTKRYTLPSADDKERAMAGLIDD